MGYQSTLDMMSLLSARVRINYHDDGPSAHRARCLRQSPRSRLCRHACMLLLLLLRSACMLDEPACMNRHAWTGMHAAAAADTVSRVHMYTLIVHSNCTHAAIVHTQFAVTNNFKIT
jgi:hypothetical protein